MELSDGDLVRAVLGGRREAFEEIVRRHAGRIRAVCWARLGRRGPVDDMVQEAFLRGYRALATLTEPDKLGNWLYGIALRACLDWLKAKERSQVSFDADFPDSRLPDPDAEERRTRLLDAVEALPDLYREVIVMFYFGPRSYLEMSATLGISPAAINARLTKARAMLRERLAGAPTP